MYAFVYINDTIKKSYYNLINIIANYFYKKNIKKYSDNNCNTYISNIQIKKTCLDICVKKLTINKIHDLINKVKINKFNIILFPTKYILPFSFIIFDSINLEITNTFEFNLKTDNSQNNKIPITSNLDKKINLGLDKLKRIIKFVTNKQKFLVKNFTILYLKCFKIHCKNLTIDKHDEKYILKCKHIELLYNKNKFIKIIDFDIYFDKYINFVIKNISINIDDKLIDIKKIYEVINKINIITDDNNKSEIKVHISNLKIQYNNINNFWVNIKNLDFKNDILIVESLIIKSFLKNIVSVNNITINFKKSKCEISNFIFEFYKSFGKKLKISFSKYIKKTIISDKNFKFSGFNINQKYITELLFKKKIPFGLDSLNSLPNSIHQSFLISNNNNLDIHNEYIRKSHFTKYSFTILNLNINFHDKNKKISKWIISNFEYNYSLNKCKNYICNDWLILNSNDVVLVKKLHNNNTPLLILNYESNKLNVILSSLYLNVEPDTFINIYKIISQNIEDINKMFFHNYSSNYVDSDFFIKYMHVNSFNIKIFYYPEKCSYYSILFGNYTEIYRTINYENINLITKKIDLHYPYNFGEMFKKIFKIWIKDIYNNQINKIILGTKFRSTINNAPVIITKNVLSSIKKLYNILNEMLN